MAVDAVEVPWILGPALITGRAELVRLVAAGNPVTPEDIQKVITFAEGVARMIEKERQSYQTIEHSVEEMARQVSGIGLALDRLGVALKEAKNGSDPEVIVEALRNPRRRGSEYEVK